MQRKVSIYNLSKRSAGEIFLLQRVRNSRSRLLRLVKRIRSQWTRCIVRHLDPDPFVHVCNETDDDTHNLTGNRDWVRRVQKTAIGTLTVWLNNWTFVLFSRLGGVKTCPLLTPFVSDLFTHPNTSRTHDVLSRTINRVPRWLLESRLLTDLDHTWQHLSPLDLPLGPLCAGYSPCRHPVHQTCSRHGQPSHRQFKFCLKYDRNYRKKKTRS